MTAAEAARKLIPKRPKIKIDNGGLNLEPISIPLIQETNSRA